MRLVKAGLFISLDGVVESPRDWQQPFDAQIAAIMDEGLKDSDAILLGTNTYLQFAGFWPTADDSVPMAKYLNNTTKYVASSTLDHLDWANSTLLHGDLVSEVKRIKTLPGKNIQIPGSPRLVYSLLAAGLLDELALMIQPVVVGTGQRLFDTGTRIKLEQTDARPLDNGSVLVVYRPTGT